MAFTTGEVREIGRIGTAVRLDFPSESVNVGLDSGGKMSHGAVVRSVILTLDLAAAAYLWFVLGLLISCGLCLAWRRLRSIFTHRFQSR